MGPAAGYGSHKDIKLTLLNKVAAYNIYIENTDLKKYNNNFYSYQVANLFKFLSSMYSNKQTEAIERGTSLQTKRDQHLPSAREWHCLLIEVKI